MNLNPFKSTSVEFAFQLPRDTAVENLRQQVGDPKSSSEQERLVGSVAQTDTYLYRSIPRTRNSFRPTFYGSFSASDSGTVLKGSITLNRVIQKFLKIWLAIVVLALLATIVTVVTNPLASWTSVLQLIVPAVAIFLFCLVLMNKCTADVDWLKKAITDAVEVTK